MVPHIDVMLCVTLLRKKARICRIELPGAALLLYSCAAFLGTYQSASSQRFSYIGLQREASLNADIELSPD